MNALISFFFVIAAIVGIIYLQIFLSRSDSKLPGLILPLLTFTFWLVIGISFIAFTAYTPGNVSDANSGLLGSVAESVSKAPYMDTSSFVGVLAATFVICNVPTAVLLAIYASCRGKKRRNTDLERMQIQDIE